MLTQFIKILATLLIVVDPIGLVPIYLALTGSMDAARRRSVFRTALLVSFLVMATFILAGSFILKVLGISPGAFYVSGGILLFLTAVDMLYGKAKRSSGHDSSTEAQEEAGNVAIFPLAIPMIAGPGSITAIILFTGSGDSPLGAGAMLLAAAVLTLGAAALAMAASRGILRLVGKKGVTVLERIMGLLLAGLSIQFAYEGLLRLGFLGGT